MSAKQTITLAIEPALLDQIREIAASESRSVGAVVTDALRGLVAQDRTYEAARRSAKATLRSGFDLRGARLLNRHQLHDGRI